jgi:hypothetical protein
MLKKGLGNDVGLRAKKQVLLSLWQFAGHADLQTGGDRPRNFKLYEMNRFETSQ